MIASYLKKRNISVVVYGIGVATLIAEKSMSDQSELGWFFDVVMWIAAVSLLLACWFYLMAKKRSGVWLFLIPLNLVAFIFYYYLEDHSSQPDSVKCTACEGANNPGDKLCRYCKSVLPVVETVAIQR